MKIVEVKGLITPDEENWRKADKIVGLYFNSDEAIKAIKSEFEILSVTKEGDKIEVWTGGKDHFHIVPREIKEVK